MIKKLSALLIVLLSLAACVPNEDHGRPDAAMHRSTKRGVSFDFYRLDDAMLLSPYICWFYNWGPDFRVTELDNWFGLDNVVFIPMAWNGGFDEKRIRSYVLTHPSCQYLLAYNEPNLTDQARMTPAQAADNWPRLKALADELQLKIVSPAMNYGTLAGYHDPIKWLDEFFQLVPVSDVDAIAIHCYMASPSALSNYVEKFRKYGKPVWLTEFCAWDPVPGNVETQLSYMCTALNYLEQSDLVERYAWFIPRAAGKVDSAPYMQLLTHTSPSRLTEAGSIYAGLSAFDRSVWLDASKEISSKDYVALSENGIQLRLSPDSDALMIKNLSDNQWLEYQVYIPAGNTQLELCFASPVSCSLVYYIDGKIAGFAETERSGSDMSEWKVWSVPASLPSGRHKLRIMLGRGSLNLKWIKIS